MKERNLSGYLIALLEMYWTGIVQRIFKANSTNISGQEDTNITLRPSLKEPFLTKFTDLIINIDQALFGKAANSVGMGFILEKNIPS